MQKNIRSIHDESIIEQINYFIMCLTLKPDPKQALQSLKTMMKAHSFQVAVNEDNGNILLRFEFIGSKIADLAIMTYVSANDTFSLTFSKKDRFSNFYQFHEIDDLYFKDIRESFFQYTGLETQSPKIFPNIEFVYIGNQLN